jgi:sugar lactone lactonase YvrE
VGSQGKLIGRHLPEGCANVCFGGPKRDHLFMTASQSLYMLGQYSRRRSGLKDRSKGSS